MLLGILVIIALFVIFAAIGLITDGEGFPLIGAPAAFLVLIIIGGIISGLFSA